MTARCPECQARYRIAREKIGPRGARLRCTRCDTTFRVHLQSGGSADPNDDSLRTERDVATPQPAAAAAPRAPAAGAPAAGAALARALVADADAERAKRIAAYLARWRIAADVVHDGREALVRIFRGAPQLAVLGPKLPKLDAPALCEVVRRSGQLAGLRLIRVCVAGESPEAAAYDAHVTLDAADVPEGLAAALERVAVGTKPSLVSPASSPAPAPKPPAPAQSKAPAPAPASAKPPVRTAPAPAAPAAAAAASGTDPAVAAALRLARIVVSDIVLYNPDKFAAAAAAGTAGRALAAELHEARAMFNQRVPENVRAGRDFLIEELERRARAART